MERTPRRVIVTGKNGQLAQCIHGLTLEDTNIRFLDREEFDLCKKSQMKSVLEDYHPELIVNCAAYTNVDGAESDVDGASNVNHFGLVDLATLCASMRIKIIHVSTDFVFDGEARLPYKPSDLCSPQSVYGQSKLMGELALSQLLPEDSMVIRTSWLYSEYGGNFVKTMMRLFETKDNFRVVQDQQGSPTYAVGLAKLIIHIVENRSFVPGVFHWCDKGTTTWYDFALAIGRIALDIGAISRKADVMPILGSEYGAAAPRPNYSVLQCSATTRQYPMVKQLPWEDSLKVMLERYSKLS